MGRQFLQSPELRFPVLRPDPLAIRPQLDSPLARRAFVPPNRQPELTA